MKGTVPRVLEIDVNVNQWTPNVFVQFKTMILKLDHASKSAKGLFQTYMATTSRVSASLEGGQELTFLKTFQVMMMVMLI